MYFINKDLFYSFVREDGIIEWMTAVSLFSISITGLRRLFFFKDKKVMFHFMSVLIFLIFLFGAGEEISWGQRIFGWDTPEEFARINAQSETNIHNLMWNGMRINKLIFSTFMYLLLTVFLVMGPLIYSKSQFLKSKIDNWGIPIPSYHHSIIYIVSLLLVSVIQDDKQWELMEFAFSFLLLMIVIKPRNHKVFRSS